MKLNLNYIKIIAGLGNPNKNYQNTYHNVGMLCLNYIIQKIIPPDQRIFNHQKKFKYIKINSKEFYLVFPKVFMNNSGEAIKEALEKFKAPPSQLLVIQDDSDLKIGKFKYSFGRGSAGHHGIESIFKQIKSRNFWRLRIGIAPQNNQRIPAQKLVLQKIKPKNKKIFYSVFDEFIVKLAEKLNPSSCGLISGNGRLTL